MGIEQHQVDVKILFNESMLLDGVGGVDPTVKREFVASGALDRLRLGGKKILTEEENRIYAYLTRPVRAKDEANPEGQGPIIAGHCDDLLPFERAEELFVAHGLTVLSTWHPRSKVYFWAKARPGIDVVREARELEEEGDTPSGGDRLEERVSGGRCSESVPA